MAIPTIEEIRDSLEEQPASIAPPIGLPPEWVWREQRARDLLAAIQRYVENGRDVNMTAADCRALVKWSDELHRHFAWAKEHKEKQAEKERQEQVAARKAK